MAVTTVGTAVGDGAAAEPVRTNRSWVWQVTSLSVVLGAMLGLALRSQAQIRQMQLPSNRFSGLAAAFGDLQESNKQLQVEIRRLREQSTRLETELAAGKQGSELINRQLQEIKMLAGLTPVHGPGLIITLHDSKQKVPPGMAEADFRTQAIIHDQDLNAILNELKAAGAEALAISGADRSMAQRVTSLTTARCAGPGMKVNDTVMGAPYRIYAIGNPAELESQLKIPNGVLDNAGLEALGMIQIQRTADLTIPGYAGSVSFQYAKKAE
jgi:uncharacterized protein YlxW (UPF0749 family)